MSITEIKAHLAAVLHRVAQGETIVITRYGGPVAQLVPIDTPRQEEARLAMEGIKKLSKGIRLDGLNLLELRDEGRR